MVFPDRLGRPDEFASLAVELITNSYMNGETDPHRRRRPPAAEIADAKEGSHVATIEYTTEGHRAVITINRPEARNAVNARRRQRASRRPSTGWKPTTPCGSGF